MNRRSFLKNSARAVQEAGLDSSTFTDPHRYPDGIRFVIGNGRITVENNRRRGELAGQVLRRGA